jgi:hypothetical protein
MKLKLLKGVKPDAALNKALTASAAAGLPSINVSPCQGKMLHIC